LKKRLDQALVERGLVRSRSQGREFILAGLVSVDGDPCRKPGRALSGTELITLDSTTSAQRRWRLVTKLTHVLGLASMAVVSDCASARS
jgi:23S rRNA (cytidine1920-2'-O)/16S rRNA (cytidine1409-2'-O)-methyltransferase